MTLSLGLSVKAEGWNLLRYSSATSGPCSKSPKKSANANGRPREAAILALKSLEPSNQTSGLVDGCGPDRA